MSLSEKHGQAVSALLRPPRVHPGPTMMIRQIKPIRGDAHQQTPPPICYILLSMAAPKTLRSYKALIEKRISEWQSMPRCSRCGLPESFRDMEWTEAGHCLHCADLLALEQSVKDGQREPWLREVFERWAATSRSDYDVLLCFSGGKDSTYLLDLCKNEYGLRVLAATVETGLMSQAAKDNINQAIDALGADHLWLPAHASIVEIYRYGFRACTGMGTECDVCDLCDGHLRKTLIELTIDRGIPLVVHAADPFQIIDFKLHKGSSPLLDRYSCWPDLARKRGVLRDFYEIKNFHKGPSVPKEVYPFCFLPYDEEALTEHVLKNKLISQTDPDVTNCQLIFLINFLDFLRHGYPAYIHTTAAAVTRGEISLERANAELLEWFRAYLEGTYDEPFFRGLDHLGLTLDELLETKGCTRLVTRSVRGLRTL